MNRTRIIVLGGILLVVAMLGAWGVYAHMQQAKPAAEIPTGTATTTVPAISSTTTEVPAKPNAPVPAVHPFGTVTLSLGEAARFSGITITPLSIVEDSRCPQDVQCIQAGTVRVSVRIAAGAGTNVQTVTLNRPFTTEAETITLTGVQSAKLKAGIPLTNYRLTFSVQKTNTARCYVGGCSSQLCTDQPGAISTCEYTASYGCYRTATCERQPSGSCGWTQTAALKACLANPPE